MSDYILELQEISKSFPGVQALDGVDFNLRAGEVHALVGENGAGKSTLIKVVSGVHQPDAGEIQFQGRSVTFANPLIAQQHGIAAIYQEPTLFPDLDVAENIFMGRQPLQPVTRRINRRQMYEEAGKLLRSLGMNLDPHTRVRGLSFADQQMVEIAKALSVNAQVLIMDEPTSALTLREVANLFRIARQLRDAGTAIAFISHRLEEAFELADRITVLRDGHYIGTRAVHDVTLDEVIHMMVGRTLDNMFPKQEVEQGEVMLRVDGLTKEGLFYDVSFELHRGEILGLAGLVGAGRTEVARAIFGVEPADRGIIWLNGHEAHIRSPKDALALGIAYLPENRQQHGLVLPMNITQNVTLPILREFARLGWVDRVAEQRAAQSFAERLDVRAAGLWQKVRELSGGNQQKVVLAKWLAARPQILILDEPTRGIDVGTKAAVHQLMSTLVAQGFAILMISSELPEILGMSDRIVVMYEGRVTGRFTRAEATQEKIIAAATASAPIAENTEIQCL
ncbi:MAG: sugar ABC transporter ATP-binding protein [Chloroflexi bacterium]|nr:sugar ABC transporter ATP-binding protein [Chloroflexota bacterium]